VCAGNGNVNIFTKIPFISSYYHKPKNIFHIFTDAAALLMRNNPLRMAAATAFFTTFALPPILIILFQVSRLFMGQGLLGPSLRKELSAALGPEAVEQIMNIARAMRNLTDNWLIAAGGFVFLMFVATTLFKIIRDSISELWCINIVAKKRFRYNMSARALSLVIILSIGVLLVLGIALEGIRAYIGQFINVVPEDISFIFRSTLNDVLAFALVTCWFMLLFRYLPLGRPSWKVAFVGGFVTGILFTIGKMVLRALLNQSNLTTIFGTSASIVLILLFVFYSSLILYYGASFTYEYALYKHEPIKPLSYAGHYRIEKVPEDEDLA
jgi:membrane protein